MLKKRIYLMVLSMALLGTVTGCQSHMRASGNKMITGEATVVENQLSNGIMIAYVPDTPVSAEGGQDRESSSTKQLGIVAGMIVEVTGGMLVNIGEEDNPPEDYGTVFLGISGQDTEFPDNLRTFLEKEDLSGKTIIPFLVTDDGSLELMIDHLYELEPEAELLEGIVIENELSWNEQAKVNEWLSGLGYNN